MPKKRAEGMVVRDRDEYGLSYVLPVNGEFVVLPSIVMKPNAYFILEEVGCRRELSYEEYRHLEMMEQDLACRNHHAFQRAWRILDHQHYSQDRVKLCPKSALKP